MKPWLVLAAILLGGCGRQAATLPPTPPAAPVAVGAVVRRAVPVTLRSFGNIVSTGAVDVRSRVEGQVLKVHVPDGAEVAKGQVLFTIDAEPYRIAVLRAEAQLARTQALLAKAEQDVLRFTQLVDDGYVTREQFDGANAQAAALSATVRADEAALAGARLDLAHCTIVAPISGRAGTIGIHAGNLVEANDEPPLVTLLPTRPVRAAFTVPEKYLAEVRERAQAAPLAVVARERGATGEGHEGLLTFIDNAVDRATGTIRLEATFPNEDGALWPGQFVELALQLREQADAVVAPTTAIQVGQQGTFVFVVGEDGVAQLRSVVVDRAIGDASVITTGLSGGETVITDGQLRVIPGTKVVVR